MAIVVEGTPPGMSANKIKHKMGQRASHTAELVFENVRVPAANVLGGLGDGFKIAMKTLDKTRIPVAAGSVGVARRALEESVKYAKEREAFGKPVSSFQAIQFKMAEMLMGIETGRLMTWKAAGWSTTAAARRREQHRQGLRPLKWPSTRPTRRFRFTAGMGMSVSTRWKSCCAT